MFTGIINAVGKVVKSHGNRPPRYRRSSADPLGGRLWVKTPFKRIRRGESISVDGVCLTVAAQKGKSLAFDVGRETRKITTLRHLDVGSRVNLERALRVGDRLGGHWVSGHVEQTGKIVKIERARQSWRFTVRVPKAVGKYVVPKGSLAIDGISLTVAAKRVNLVSVMIISHTLSHTTLGLKKLNDQVNLEPDLLAKYYAIR